FGIATSPERVGHHEQAPFGRPAQPQVPLLGRRVLQVWAVQSTGVEKDGHGLVERDPVFRRVGLGLSRVPLEHPFSIYGMPRHAGDNGPSRPSSMPHARLHTRKKTPKRVLALPDLEHAKSAVLSSLTSRSGQRTYDHAIREFVAWYCSEPRLAFNRTVVLRYRIHLEQRQYAP